MPWQWDLNTDRYRDLDTGRFISAANVRDLVDERQRITGSGSDGLAELLRGGQLNTRDWETGMREAIKDEYIQQYLFGRGGLSQMTQADWGSIGGMVADQYRYLGGFAREVAAGTLSEAQVAARSRMYINSGREAFERARARTDDEADEVAWTLNPAEHCPDCLDLAALGWQPREPWPFAVVGRTAIPGSGATQCLTNCKCTIDYRVAPTEEGEEPVVEPVAEPAEPIAEEAEGAAITFTDRESADEYLATNPGINPVVTNAEDAALGEYKGELYFEINQELRDAGYSTFDEADLIESAIDKAVVRQPMIVYRGADWDVFEEEDLTGDIFPDQAFVSTSLMERTASRHADGVVLEIRIPAGARALNMERWETAAAASESELLLQRDSRFRVISDNIGDDPDVRRMILELLL